MALRLTGIPTPDAAAAAPVAQSGSAFGVELRDQARLHLATGHVERYRELLERATKHEDSDSRYHARVLMLEEGLAAATKTPSHTLAIRVFVTVAQAALDALEEEPREPVLLNLAGVALYELWSLDAAHILFKAANRLDPGLPHLKRNLRELGRRRKGGRPNKPLHTAVPGLAAQARKLAPKARPADGLTLSLCMIVRDEEEMLPRCLAAVAPAVDEIIIVDTGSTDRTVEIAREFGATVIEKEWTGSFSDARNVSFDAATSDWIIYLDADEVLVADDVKRLKALTGKTWREAFYLVETSYTGELGDGGSITNSAMRVFRNRPHYRFEGRLHEQIAHRVPTYAAGRLEQSTVRIDHYGYLGAVRDAKEKSRRNLELLRAQAGEGAPSAFLHFNLGTEYAVLGEHTSALAELEAAWKLVQTNGEEGGDYVPALVQRLVTSMRLCGRAHDAIERADDGLQRFPGFTDLVFTQALASMDLGNEDDAIAHWERCIEMGDAPSRYLSATGAGTYLPRISLAHLYMRRGDVDRARELLAWCVAEHPDFIGVVEPYATVLLRSGVAPDAITGQLEAELESLTPAARFMLASALYRHGAMAPAETQYRAVLQARPSSSQVRVQLAEALLNQRRYADAAEESAQIDDADAFAGLAMRIELCSRIAAGDVDGAAEAGARAAKLGLSAAEREVFEAWRQLAADSTQEPPSLPVAATPLLGALLETLLRAQDYEAFDGLTPLLRRSALPEREQREVLASMYLEHGFLGPAAQEWMAACQSRPDARALVGLARVAERHGQFQDAIVFAGEALQLDPSDAAARELLARYAPQSGPEVALAAY
jgi:glycosyltransferase involved in cell wall biosynthesis/Tfp pilus assembly protein PilF